MKLIETSSGVFKSGPLFMYSYTIIVQWFFLRSLIVFRIDGFEIKVYRLLMHLSKIYEI